ncbi:hypothetical protein N7474_010941 [Penicillium riverlandense]|uniref:uncharacterized protein n=1 Tax=Penicillium riverlandense TaxID=1903569 RepID=UPI00254891C9|nr:uncharacterized protein N7474_010941 [Penicillium riverlandense]KAJ5805054.1 hypothetical protein N7474_010941 [Penicillium riverlandense]
MNEAVEALLELPAHTEDTRAKMAIIDAILHTVVVELPVWGSLTMGGDKDGLPVARLGLKRRNVLEGDTTEHAEASASTR